MTPKLRSLRILFFVAGAIFATWGVHVPTVKAHFGLSEETLAVAMMASGVGTLLALLLAGRVIGRWGPRAVALLTGLVSSACIGALIVFDAYLALLALMLAFGIVFAMLDVAINVVASDFEGAVGRPVMSGLHGMFSVGGMAGAGLGSLLPQWGVTAQGHLAATMFVAGALVAIGCVSMPSAAPVVSAGGPRIAATGGVRLLGLLAAIGLLAEGAMYDWSVLYLRQELNSGQSVAALAYASFSAAMAAGRFAGDGLRRRLKAAPLFRLSGAIAALGMALALLGGSATMALIGFALVGLGLANVVPVLFSAAGQLPGVAAAQSIAAVSAMGCVGMMGGPPLIGALAQSSSLQAALWIVAAAALVLAFSAGRALRAG